MSTAALVACPQRQVTWVWFRASSSQPRADQPPVPLQKRSVKATPSLSLLTVHVLPGAGRRPTLGSPTPRRLLPHAPSEACPTMSPGKHDGVWGARGAFVLEGSQGVAESPWESQSRLWTQFTSP